MAIINNKTYKDEKIYEDHQAPHIIEVINMDYSGFIAVPYKPTKRMLSAASSLGKIAPGKAYTLYQAMLDKMLQFSSCVPKSLRTKASKLSEKASNRGFIMVSKKPTTEMLKNGSLSTGMSVQKTYSIYQAMLSAYVKD